MLVVMASPLSTGLQGSPRGGGGGSYQQGGPSSPQAARSVLNQLGGQIAGFGNVPAALTRSGVLIQSIASGSPGESISVALTSKPANLPAPSGLAFGAVAGGGTATFDGLTAFFWTITAVNANGETVGSNEVTGTPATGGHAHLTWTGPALTLAEATSYKIYRAAGTGGETSGSTLVGTAPAGSTSYDDPGTAASASHAPTVNTAVTDQNVYATVSSNAITVNLPVDGSGNSTARASAVRNAINGTPAAHALVSAAVRPENDPAGIVAAAGSANLAGDTVQSQGVAGSAPLPKQHPVRNSYN